MDEQSKHSEIMLSLGRLEGQTISINQHLGQLNSKVATHEGRLNHMDVEDGKLGVFLESMKTEQKKENSLKSKWLDRVLMLVFMGILQLGALVLIRAGIVNLEKEPQGVVEKQKALVEATSEAQKLQIELQNQ